METPLYKSTPLNNNQTRVVWLPRSRTGGIDPKIDRPLNCRLEVITPSETKIGYEALSYCWGKNKPKERVEILLNGESFLVSPTLRDALESMCSPEKIRAVWVDAISINQDDTVEKSIQVSRMREFYHNAKKTLVWVGKADDNTGKAFEQIRRLYETTSDDERKKIWGEEGAWIKSLKKIIKQPYWTRGWTVQEVVLSADSLLYCGRNCIPFFELATVLDHPQAIKQIDNFTYGVYAYLKTVFAMRSPDWKDPELGLFALAYYFRRRKLTKPLDRVYAFRGLLKSADLPQGDAGVVEYEQKEEEVWMTLVKETISRHQTLLPIIVAERDQLDEASWCLDFSTNYGEYTLKWEDRMLFWSGGLDNFGHFPLQTVTHSAAGGLPAQVDVDLKAKSVISVKGFTVDEVIAVGDRVGSLVGAFGRPNYIKVFTGWEIMLGGPWDFEPEKNRDKITVARDRKMTEKFARTVTGGAWTQEPQDWKTWNKLDFSEHPWNLRYLRETLIGDFDDLERPYDASWEEEPNYQHVRDHACEGRRLIMLKSGKFGLGPENADIGDMVVVLLGCDVPILLRSRNLNKWYSRILDDEKKEKKKLYGNTWKYVGQAYVDEFMRYQGDLNRDITCGKVKLETFFLD